MPLSRRLFLRTGTLSALAAGCVLRPGLSAFGQESAGSASGLGFEVPYAAGQNSIFYYTRETFEPYVGATFRGLTRGRPVRLTLLSVVGYTPARETKLSTKPSPPTNTFTLTFRASRQLSPLTKYFELQHAALGQFGLYMTQFVSPEGGVFYEAVFNQLA